MLLLSVVNGIGGKDKWSKAKEEKRERRESFFLFPFSFFF